MSRNDNSSGKKFSGRQGDGPKKKSMARGNAPVKKDSAPKNAPKPASKTSPKAEGIRLNKYISNSGACSRRDADIYIGSGNVTVDDKIVTEMGYRVKPNEVVKFDGRRVI